MQFQRTSSSNAFLIDHNLGDAFSSGILNANRNTTAMMNDTAVHEAEVHDSLEQLTDICSSALNETSCNKEEQQPRNGEGERNSDNNGNDAAPPQSSVDVQDILLPDLLNDENIPVISSKTDHPYHIYTLYCGRYMGRNNIGSMNGCCGSDGRSQCPSCERLQNSSGTRVEMLKRLYPALRNEGEYLHAKLRSSFGFISKCMSDIDEESGAVRIDSEYAMSDIIPFAPRKSTHYDEAIQSIMNLVDGSTSAMAAYVLERNHFDTNSAAEDLLSMFQAQKDRSHDSDDDSNDEDSDDDDDDTSEFNEMMKRIPLDEKQHLDDLKERNKKRMEAVKTALRAGLKPDFDPRKALKSSLDNMYCIPISTLPTSTNEAKEAKPSIVIKNGHRMVLAQENNDDASAANIKHCYVCASKVPSPCGGSYYCEQCQICEGCLEQFCVPGGTISDNVRDKNEITFPCPAVANGGVYHHHPLKFIPGRSSRCICDLCDVRGSIAFSCEACDFDICHKCIRTVPRSKGFDRKTYSYVTESEEEEEEEDVEDFTGDYDENNDDDNNDQDSNDVGSDDEESKDNRRSVRERMVAERWEGSALAAASRSGNDRIMLGSGDVRTTVPLTSGFANAPRRFPVRTISGGLKVSTKPSDGMLGDKASRALSDFELQRSRCCIATADMIHAEDLLLRVNRGSSTRSKTYKMMLSSIASGDIGVAGTVMLSKFYAPAIDKDEDDSSDDGSEAENIRDDSSGEILCWCGDPINSSTSPDGAVGCLGGHAMHTACAADLLLGGGKCPTCRQALFFTRVGPSEIRAAAKFAKNEVERARLEEEERVKEEIAMLAKSGEELKFKMGDIVRVSPDRSYCERAQCQDPITGYWHEDMAAACGLEGRVTEIVERDERIVSVRVLCTGRHRFKRKKVDVGLFFECPECGSRRNGQRMCIDCDFCELCCRRTINDCPKKRQEYFWSPSVLSLIGRADRSKFIGQDGPGSKLERDMLMLRGELVSVKAAREALKKDSEELLSEVKMPRMIGKMKRQLSYESSNVVTELVNASRTDWQRAYHLFSLAHEWEKRSSYGKQQRTDLYSAIREGNLDTAARIIRRYNAERTTEEAKWEDAVAETSDYIIEPGAVVDLRARPSTTAPKTGHTLRASCTFCSQKEILDKDENMWIKVKVPEPEDSEEPEGEKPIPPQGWLKVRPCGDTGPAIAKRRTTSLRCFSCGDLLIPVVSVDEKYGAVETKTVKVGDISLVAATLEKVKVHSVRDHRIFCSFMNTASDEGSNDDDDDDDLVWYRASDLVKPRQSFDYQDETIEFAGKCRSRRELVLSFSGDMKRAKEAWDQTIESKPKEMNKQIAFASCIRGHLFHARCFQEALMTGSRCPAPGCTEQIFVPNITHTRNDDDACCGEDNEDAGEIRALEVASEVESASNSMLASARTSNGRGDQVREDTEDAIGSELKMCPMCCAGPLFNQNCSDMKTHHGQCSVRALDRNSSSCLPCGSDFRAAPSDIAARMAQVSSTKSVTDLLPRCEMHKAVVMFNGCLSCGHLFTDIQWHDMPKYDPDASLHLKLDQKRRNAAKLLSEQIRAEAALLQYERDRLQEAQCYIKHEGELNSTQLKKRIKPPPMPYLSSDDDVYSSDSDYDY